MAPMVGAVAIIILTFVLATAYGEVRASAIDHETEQIQENAFPSLTLLSAARAALRRLEVASDELVEERGERRREAALTIEAARKDVDRDLTSEFATDAYPGEVELQAITMRRLSELDALIGRMRGHRPDASGRRSCRASS